MWAALLVTTPSWVAESQQQLGVKLDYIKNYSRSPGPLWTLPSSTDDFAGLGYARPLSTAVSPSLRPRPQWHYRPE